ncbi:hypothetical protein GCM10022243_32180 [Saccharothrix violaceirubra]|uniref:Transcriptional regulator with XRE-family HTH domain n=1 Tax=Saccharothrix violaceirubra TaxID=413306 RepID=A0A7W7T7S6_9PSEU|nr:Scr1 family TA system antitoxin-like transcriptional regulator [Saccharothrix violaceirubra]MBB4966840.1 transcriptional regulator with XRE-family HTH domain [Saccharothrix violaceirubra]
MTADSTTASTRSGGDFVGTVVDGYRAGATIRELADLTGRGYGTVRSTLIREGVELRPRAEHGQPDFRGNHEQLATLLLKARLPTGLTGQQAARQAGFSQAKLSKMETGSLIPKPADVAALADVYETTADERTLMITLARRVAEEARRRRITHIDAARNPARPSCLSRTASAIRVVALSHVPDVLLDDLPTHQVITAVLAETVLHCVPTATTDLREANSRNAVDLRILPLTAPGPDCGFTIYDTDAVVIGTAGGTATLTDPAHISHYLDLFTRLHDAALAPHELDDRSRHADHRE